MPFQLILGFHVHCHHFAEACMVLSISTWFHCYEEWLKPPRCQIHRHCHSKILLSCDLEFLLESVHLEELIFTPVHVSTLHRPPPPVVFLVVFEIFLVYFELKLWPWPSRGHLWAPRVIGRRSGMIFDNFWTLTLDDLDPKNVTEEPNAVISEHLRPPGTLFVQFLNFDLDHFWSRRHVT